MSTRNAIFAGIMLFALVLILAATPIGAALWNGLVTTVDSAALFLWSLRPK